ncbi:MAG: hypothetical protein LBT01_08420 [Spirochaetaceae bacterium]|jgi:hypothetical protein|nr:hypothetical protein [Spirochaetaceae bacterium]
MKMKLLVCTAFTVLAFASCNAIADTSGLSMTPETVWLSLAATEPELVNGLRTATLTLDFDKAVDGLNEGLPEADLNNLFTFSYGSSSIKVTKLIKSVVGIYTLTVVNVPEDTEGIVLVKINQTGITPTIRPWFLDGTSGPPVTIRATAATGCKNRSGFSAVAKDADGSTYAVGSQFGGQAFTYGDGKTAQGAGIQSAVLVKYDSTGAVEWAKAIAASPKSEDVVGGYISGFEGVAVDGKGGIYVVGYQNQAGIYNWGPGVSTTTGAGHYAVIVKYDSTGAALWVKTTESPSTSSFTGVAADGKGNVYAVGHQFGANPYDYDDGQTAQSDNGSGRNAVIVQYDSATGTTRWALTVNGGDATTEFYDVAADGSGNVYVVGDQRGTGTFVYDGGKSITGANTDNAVILKYSSAGSVQWAQAASGGDAGFLGVTLDSADNIYAAGAQIGTGTFSYGTNGSKATAGANEMNAVLVKFNAAGAALWATAAQSEVQSSFYGVAADGRGHVYATGGQGGSDACDYVGASATGGSALFNASVVQYDSATGAALWAQSVSGADGHSQFLGVAADGRGNFTAVGVQNGDEVFDYGNNITAQSDFAGSADKNLSSVIVFYK